MNPAILVIVYFYSWFITRVYLSNYSLVQRNFNLEKTIEVKPDETISPTVNLYHNIKYQNNCARVDYKIIL